MSFPTSSDESRAFQDHQQDMADSIRPSRNAYDIQKEKLDKLMENPEKALPPILQSGAKVKKDPKIRDFVRNVAGSSSGASSAEFHIYRKHRRWEMEREKVLKEETEHDNLIKQHEEKMNSFRQKEEEKTLKNRIKRLKQKARKLQHKHSPNDHPLESSDSDSHGSADQQE